MNSENNIFSLGDRIVSSRVFKYALTITILSIVLTMAWKELHSLRWLDVKNTSASVPGRELLLCLLLTFCAIASMGFYDALAIPSGKNRVSFHARWLVGIFAFAWSNLLSVGGLAGPTIRFFLYRRLGLENREVIFGLSIHYLAAVFGLGAWMLAVFTPLPTHWSFAQVLLSQTLLALCFSVLIAFLFTRLVARWMMARLQNRYPDMDLYQPPFILLALVSFADWTFTYYAFELLVNATAQNTLGNPQSATFFIGILVGFASLLPAGLGAADSVWLHFLLREMNAANAAATILLYRVIFYFIPWFLAAFSGYIYLTRTMNRLHEWHRRIVATAVAIGAGLLLLSGALPAMPERMKWLSKITPLSLIEVSHLLSVSLAAIMLFTVRGLLRGYRSAMLLTLGLLSASVLTHLLKGWDLEESSIALILIFMLLISQRQFTRRGSFSLGWELLLGIFAGMFCLYTFTGFAAFENVHYHSELWTKIAARADASRFLRSLPVLFLIGVVFIVREAMKPKRHKDYAIKDDIERAEKFARLHAETADSLLIGGGDKAVWFWSPEGVDRGLVLYQHSDDNLMVYKDPLVDDPSARRELLRAFMQFCAEKDLDPIFSMISVKWLDVLHDFGFRFVKLTQEAIIDLKQFTLAGGSRSSWRYTLRNAEKKGIHYEVLQAPHSADVVAQCRAVSDDWLQAKGGSEMQFSACYFSDAYLQRNPLGVARDENNNIVAFVNILIARPEGCATFDFMRYRPGVLNALMDFVILKTALHCQELGCSSLSLGGAALSSVGREKSSFLVERGLRLFSLQAERVYNYQGLYNYKNKFDPQWQPRYLAYRYPFDWGPALLANLRVVKPSREDRRRIERAHSAPDYPFD